MPSRNGAPVWRLFVFFASLVGLLAVSRPARAIGITVVNEASLPRLDKDGKTITKRPQTLTPEGVSYQDCVDDQQILFTLQMTGFEPRAAIEVWASVNQDCTSAANRGGAAAQCWRVYDANIPLAATADVRIPVRKIMYGAPPFGPLKPPEKSEDLCGQIDLKNIKVDFIYFPPGQQGSTGEVAKSVAVTVDTVGPEPPTGLKALPGNTRIRVDWNSISGGSEDASTGTATAGVVELTGVNVYCDVAGATTTTTANEPVCHEELVDAGPDAEPGSIEVCEDGGTTTSNTGTCSSPNFVNADGSEVFPDKEFDSKYLCGSITGSTGTSVMASSVAGKPLVNGTEYALALAATDRFGNVGNLSAVRCQTPQETTDFWNDYRNAGGHAGDGCSTSGTDAPLGSIATLGVGVAMALSSILRTRRGRASRKEGHTK